MGVTGRADGDRVDVFGGEDRVDFGDFGARGLGQGRGGRRFGVGDQNHLAVGPRSDVAAVDLADPACADDAEISCFPPLAGEPKLTPFKKEYTFHIDLGIEFLFHSPGERTARRSGHASAFRRRGAQPRGRNAHGQDPCPRGRRDRAPSLPRAGQSRRQDRHRHRRHAGAWGRRSRDCSPSAARRES